MIYTCEKDRLSIPGIGGLFLLSQFLRTEWTKQKLSLSSGESTRNRKIRNG